MMNPKNLLYLVIFVLTLFSCGKDDGPTTPDNTAPVITNTTKTFTVAENINDTFVIGTVTATDADDDALTFSIATNSDNLFEISATGALSLAAGKTLSFATKSSHTLSISVNDGTVTTKANFTVNVTQVVATNETPVIGAQSFEVAENINDTFVIGTVTATDAENNPLTFSISEDASGLFEISSTTGELSLLVGESLDFATAEEHKLTISVSDGNTAAQAEITITVTKVDGAPIMEAQTFEIEENSESPEIGMVVASDPDDDALSFAMVTNDNGLFQITEEGALSLVSDPLDFEANEQHTITVSVDDGNGHVVEAVMTINVLDVNESPKIADQAFEVAEDIADNVTIGTVLASDPENNNLTFSIKTNTTTPLDLFEITANGTLSLKTGKSLNYEVSTEHVIVVEVTDGTNSPDSAEITITVTNVIDNLSEDPEAFVTRWFTNGNPEVVKIGVDSNLNYDYTIDWGDGTVQQIMDSNDPTHVYASSGVYTVAIKGVFPRIFMGSVSLNQTQKNRLVSIDQWGSNQWTSMRDAFRDCESVTLSATDAPNLSQTTNLRSMFNGATSFNGDISEWDVSNITMMQNMFNFASSFNQNLGDWDISNVENMSAIFSFSDLSPSNYAATLQGWASVVQSNGSPGNVSLGAVGIEYCNTQLTLNARNYLINTHLWNIDDGGPTNICN